MPRKVAVVAHTHWDREWREPFPAARLALVELLDEVLPRLDYPFLLDGQMALLDDYLDARPDAEALVRKRIDEGLLTLGPWYVQADAFQVSGETLARNLEIGRRRAAEFGAPMAVGYLPDAFGHAAQLPQLLRQAGIEHAVVWRGVPSSVRHTAFRWEAPDGSAVRAEYLPVGYGNGAALPAGPVALVRRVVVHDDELAGWWLGDLLLMNGTDRSRPAAHLPAAVAAANAVQDEYRFGLTTLAAYLAEAPTTGLATVIGELRSAARAPVLSGVLSNRVDLKQAAAGAERALERRAEPLAALALPAERWPGRILELAWLDLLRNAAHDSISGCSVDEVGAAVLQRYAEVTQAADAVSVSALEALAGSFAEPGSYVVNLSPRPRSGLVEVHETDAPVREGLDMTGRELSRYLQRPPPGMPEEERRELFARAGAQPGATFHIDIERVSSRTRLRRVENVPPFGWRRVDDAPPVAPPPAVDSTVLPAFVDEADLGDTYTASPGAVLFDQPDRDEQTLVEDGPLHRVLRVDRWYGDEMISTDVETRAGERLLRFTTRWDNVRTGHRLRAVFPARERAHYSYAECAFAVARRGLEGEGGPYEMASAAFPSRRFVSAGEVTVFHDGLLEYEIVDDGQGLALTLLRSTEWLSRPDNPHRPVPAGPEVQLRGPSLIGPRVARYALHVGPCDPYALADDFLVPLEVVVAAGGGTRPAEGRLLDIDLDGLHVSSVRRDGDEVAVRTFIPNGTIAVRRVPL